MISTITTTKTTKNLVKKPRNNQTTVQTHTQAPRIHDREMVTVTSLVKRKRRVKERTK